MATLKSDHSFDQESSFSSQKIAIGAEKILARDFTNDFSDESSFCGGNAAIKCGRDLYRKNKLCWVGYVVRIPDNR